MNNSTRNTIVLAVVFVLLATFWLILHFNLTKKINILLATNKQSALSIDSLNVLLSFRDSLESEYELKQALMNQQSKLIIGEDSPTVTYGYLLNLLSWKGLGISYDFAAKDSVAGQTGFNEYIISGRTHYSNLLNLADQIERQRAVITIEDMSIATEGVAQADTVIFSMVLHTHYRPGGPLADELALGKFDPPFTGYSLFKPRIAEEILPYDIDPTLMIVEDAKLIGITRGMAFFRDNQGIIRILTRGSQVAYGYLYRIDEAAGKVIFRLAKYGLEEDYTVQIKNTQ